MLDVPTVPEGCCVAAPLPTRSDPLEAPLRSIMPPWADAIAVLPRMSAAAVHRINLVRIISP